MMTPQLQAEIRKAQDDLSIVEQMELLAVISQSLQNQYQRLSKNNDFWKPKTLKQLSDEQSVQAVKSFADLATNFWPGEESVDEFNDFIYKQRDEDRLRDS